MKFSLSLMDQISVLRSLSKICKSSNTMPMLSHALVDISDGKMTIGVTDLDVYADFSFPIDADDSIRFCVPFKKFIGIFAEVGSADVEVSRNVVTFRSGEAEFSLHIRDADEFPEFFRNDFSRSIQIRLGDFVSTLEPLLVQDVGLAFLSYESLILVRFSETGLAAYTATPTSVTSAAVDLISCGDLEFCTMISSMESALSVLKCLDENEIVTVGLSQSQVRFSTDDVSVSALLSQDSIPSNIDDILQSTKNYENKFIVNSKLFCDLLKRSYLTEDESVTISAMDNEISLHSESVTLEFAEHVPVRQFGKSFSVTIPTSKLMKLLDKLPATSALALSAPQTGKEPVSVFVDTGAGTKYHYITTQINKMEGRDG